MFQRRMVLHIFSWSTSLRMISITWATKENENIIFFWSSLVRFLLRVAFVCFLELTGDVPASPVTVYPNAAKGKQDKNNMERWQNMSLYYYYSGVWPLSLHARRTPPPCSPLWFFHCFDTGCFPFVSETHTRTVVLTCHLHPSATVSRVISNFGWTIPLITVSQCSFLHWPRQWRHLAAIDGYLSVNGSPGKH